MFIPWTAQKPKKADLRDQWAAVNESSKVKLEGTISKILALSSTEKGARPAAKNTKRVRIVRLKLPDEKKSGDYIKGSDIFPELFTGFHW